YAAVMAERATQMSEQWRDNSTLDIHREMTRLTLGITAKTLFDADVDSEADEIGQALTAALKLFTTIFLPFGEWLERLPLPSVRRFKRARARLDEVVYGMIAQRRATGEDRGDLLSMLLHAQDVEGDGGSMTDQQLRDECMTLFLAGHETTANALTWT